MDDPAPELLTLNDVAEILRCSKAHVCKVVRGEVHGITPIPAICLGRRKLVRRESLLQWIAANELGGGATIRSSLEVDAGRRA
jgi:Helix-turn-helix domain